MDKTIVTALLVMAGVISAVVLFNTLYPMLQQSGDAMTSMERRMDDRIKSQVQIIHAAKALDNTVQIWVKNVGASRIVGVESSDVFFGPEGNFARIPYGSGSPHWEYTVENGTDWVPTATLRISVIDDGALPSGRYYTKIVLPNGVADDEIVSW